MSDHTQAIVMEGVNCHLAEVIVDRLNHLIKNKHIATAVEHLINNRVTFAGGSPESISLIAHPTIQVSKDADLGFLGLLNGLVGAIPYRDGVRHTRAGWGYVSAYYSDDGLLTHFELTQYKEAL